MITAAKPKPQLRAGARMSLEEFLALGETDGRWELDEEFSALCRQPAWTTSF